MDQNSPKTHHRSGRLAAYILLALGAGILVFVFFVAKDMLDHPIPGLTLLTASTTATPDFGKMGAAVVTFLMRLLVLLIITIVGSVIASRGIHLYYVASAPRDKANADVVGRRSVADSSDTNSAS